MLLSIDALQMFIEFGTDKGLEMTKKAGFDCVDYPIYWSKFYDTLLDDDFCAYAKKEKEILDKNNILCNQAHAPFSKFTYGDKMSVENEDYLKTVRSVKVAKILGAKYVVIHSVTVPHGVDFEKYNFEFYKSLEKYAEENNIKIAVENLYGYDEKRQCYTGKLGSPKELCDFVKKLGTKNFTTCIDIGHAALTGFEPDEFIMSVDDDLIGVFHIHDNDYRDDLHHLPYFGLFDWDKITKAIAMKNCKCDFSMEISSHFQHFDKKLFYDVLVLAEKTGRNLIGKINAAK